MSRLSPRLRSKRSCRPAAWSRIGACGERLCRASCWPSELERLVGRQEELQQDSVAFIECDREFHRTIVRAAGNPVLADFYESLRDRQLRMGLHAIAISGGRAAPCWPSMPPSSRRYARGNPSARQPRWHCTCPTRSRPCGCRPASVGRAALADTQRKPAVKMVPVHMSQAGRQIHMVSGAQRNERLSS